MASKIGLIGCGMWGGNILRDMRSLGCEVVVVEPDAARRARALEDGAAGAEADVDALPAVDGIVVATPATTHAAIIDRLLPRGVPVFVEKPLTVDAAGAERIAAQGVGRIYVMHVWRYHAGVQALADIAASGELGAVRGLRTTRTNWTSPRRDIDPIWTLAPHDVSIALAVLGFIPEPRWALAERCDGMPVGLLAALGDEPWLVLECSTRYRDKRREVRLHCDAGVAVLPDADAGHIEISRGSPADAASAPQVERRAYDAEPALLRELRTFVEHLSGGPPPPTTAAEGAAVVGAVERLRRLAGL